LALWAGCKVSKGRVREWADRKDAYRLSRVVADGKQSPEVRQEAALALVRLERFYELERALHQARVGDRHRITDALVDRLVGVVKKPDGDEAAVVRAKDGLFSAWFFARPAQRRVIEETLTRWIVQGEPGGGGEHNIERILKSFGRRGANLIASITPVEHPRLFVYDKKQVVSPSCLLGTFWKTAGPEVRATTTRRFIQAAKQDKKLSLSNEGGLLLSIGALGGHEGVSFLEGLLRQDPDVKVRTFAVIALRIAAERERGLVGDSVRDAALAELARLMAVVNEGKALPNPTLRGVSFVEHLFELALLFPGDATFEGLAGFVGAPNPKLEDADLAGIRTFLRLLCVGFLMRHGPTRALKMAYAKLLPEEDHPLGYLNQTLLDSAIFVWKQTPKRRADLLAGLRLGLSDPSWVAKAIAVEGLALGELLPREGLEGDLAALRGLVGDKTALRGDDWRGATLGERAKKAVETLSKTK
jgi:hypothetical protein